MKEIVIATKNQHKIIEMKAVLEPLGYKVLSLFDFQEFPDIVEDQDTFKGNAWKKAKELSEYLQKTVIADDSGLEVEALDSRPGIYSARYAGEHATYQDNNAKLLEEMKDKKNRNARFVTAMCVYQEGQDPIYIEEYLYGSIAFDYKGNNGFGYDPLFIVKESNKRLAEYTTEEKNAISHRGKCLVELSKILQRIDAFSK
jgi:XTP/dITP diphosphohydrolase